MSRNIAWTIIFYSNVFVSAKCHDGCARTMWITHTHTHTPDMVVLCMRGLSASIWWCRVCESCVKVVYTRPSNWLVTVVVYVWSFLLLSPKKKEKKRKFRLCGRIRVWSNANGHYSCIAVVIVRRSLARIICVACTAIIVCVRARLCRRTCLRSFGIQAHFVHVHRAPSIYRCHAWSAQYPRRTMYLQSGSISLFLFILRIQIGKKTKCHFSWDYCARLLMRKQKKNTNDRNKDEWQ